MVNYSEAVLDATFAALADPTRRAILARLADGEASVGEVAAPFEMSLPAVSKHLGVLENAGLIGRHKDGRVRRCNLDAAPLKQAVDWISTYRRFCEERLDSLARYLQQQRQQEEANHGDTGSDDERGQP